MKLLNKNKSKRVKSKKINKIPDVQFFSFE